MNEVTVQDNAGALMQIINRAATDAAFDVAKLQALLAVKKEWEADEARKAFHVAFSAFKAEAVRIIRNKTIADGPLKNRRYADLFTVVDAVTPALSQHGLSHSWVTTKNEKDWIEVACTLTHVAGHAERREFGGPPDTGGAKNPIQARASTLSYLQRYTLLMVLGMAVSDQDDDGRGGQDQRADSPWTDVVKEAAVAAATGGLAEYQAWWKAQPAQFRRAAASTMEHADFKAMAESAA